MSNRLLVFGGNGFLGKRICQEAVQKGFIVTSLSRSGRPPLPNNLDDTKWISETEWVSGNIFDPSTYIQFLKGKPHVVHSLGILLEDKNYKKNIKSPLSGLNLNLSVPKLFQLPNPLHKKNTMFSYEWMNKRSALILAEAYNSILKKDDIDNAAIPSFTYVSADKGFPLIPEGYIKSKREAETALLHEHNKFRPIVLRPGFMFDEIKGTVDARTIIQNGIDILNCGNNVLLNNRMSWVNNTIRPTISTQQVARNSIKRIQNETFNGIVYLEDLLKP